MWFGKKSWLKIISEKNLKIKNLKKFNLLLNLRNKSKINKLWYKKLILVKKWWLMNYKKSKNCVKYKSKN